jgi:hypothetical protein
MMLVKGHDRLQEIGGYVDGIQIEIKCKGAIDFAASPKLWKHTPFKQKFQSILHNLRRKKLRLLLIHPYSRELIDVLDNTYWQQYWN